MHYSLRTLVVVMLLVPPIVAGACLGWHWLLSHIGTIGGLAA
jgi:hypothetical protein